MVGGVLNPLVLAGWTKVKYHPVCIRHLYPDPVNPGGDTARRLV